MRTIILLILFGFNISLKAQPLPINSNATPAVKKVLKALYKVREEGKLLTCQHIRERTSRIFDDRSEYKHVFDVTGKFPAMLGVDFFLNPGAAVTSSIQHWKRGGFVTITWHQSNPAIEYQGAWNTVQSKMSEEEFQQLINPGTQLYKLWLDHIDRMAGYLKTLHDSGVVVLWRPYHEMNGSWFWWGNKGRAFPQMWMNMYNRYTQYHKLNNLIWVYGPNIGVGDPAIYYPGSQYVDIGGFDIYNSTRKLDIAQHDNLKNILEGKPIAMTETGVLPTVEDMINNSEYIWFMPWHTAWCDNTFYGMPSSNGPGNTADILREYYSHPQVITLESLEKYYSKD